MSVILTSEYVLPSSMDGVPPTVRMSQYETARKIQFSLRTDDIFTNQPDGYYEVTILGVKPDGRLYSRECEFDRVNKMITLPQDIQITAAPGKWNAKIKIAHSEDIVYTGRVQFVIDPDPLGMDEETPSIDVIIGIKDMVDKAEVMTTYIEDVLSQGIYADEVQY